MRRFGECFFEKNIPQERIERARYLFTRRFLRKILPNSKFARNSFPETSEYFGRVLRVNVKIALYIGKLNNDRNVFKTYEN